MDVKMKPDLRFPSLQRLGRKRTQQKRFVGDVGEMLKHQGHLAVGRNVRSLRTGGTSVQRRCSQDVIQAKEEWTNQVRLQRATQSMGTRKHRSNSLSEAKALGRVIPHPRTHVSVLLFTSIRSKTTETIAL